ncbi:MAG: nickel pincer cofactor biosynthesis protein LarC [Mycobacteriales bacterium]
MTGWLDCSAGATGEMLLGAVIDAGAPVEAVRIALAALEIGAIRLEVATVERGGIGATKVDVISPRTSVTRTVAHVRDRIERAGLDGWVTAAALSAFAKLTEASAASQRSRPELVHLHEIGGIDAVCDIVGTVVGLRELDIRSLTASTVTVGTGMAAGEHGLMPVPPPSVITMLSDAGAPVWSGPAPYEMCTPTGAALLATLVSDWEPLPEMTVRRVGHGAGRRDLDELPHLLRLLVGERTAPDRPGLGQQTVLEANVDDLDPRLWPGVLDGLLAAGAVDAWLTPIVMKKCRPAHTLHVLVPPARVDVVRDAVFACTSTIGLREYAVTKHALDREHATVTVDGVPVGVKIARLRGRVVNISVEYDDVRAAAERLGRPVKETLQAAGAAAHDRFGATPDRP